MKTNMRCILVEKHPDGSRPRLGELPTRDLPVGEVLVEVSHTALNYSDAVTIFSKWGDPPSYPHVPGIDFAGVVVSSSTDRFKVGQNVFHTGHGVGYTRWGGMAEYARSNGDWLLAAPTGFDGRALMTLGTPALTALLAVEALERNGVTAGAGPVAVTGASGAVGSLTCAYSSRLGYRVTAVTGKPSEAARLRTLGAEQVIAPADFAASDNREFSAVIDTVGGKVVTRALARVRYEGVVVVAGAASGFGWGVDGVLPLILQATTIVGLNSVHVGSERRRRAWSRASELTDAELLAQVGRTHEFAKIPELAEQMLAGQTQGRIVCAVSD